MELGLLGALMIGLSLGLLGSGGSILSVPTLVFLVGQDEKVAIAGSLAIVGTVSLLGVGPYARRRLVDWRSVLCFGLPGMVGTSIGACQEPFDVWQRLPSIGAEARHRTQQPRHDKVADQSVT